ncbi:unnamed protein product [Meloidogyne enterolobii]|uniref:Uncharacterized protein n=1 Tax=Meloidogyne enterolobii TaxID=390850 RepID=A0ACB0ZL66_MELEN
MQNTTSPPTTPFVPATLISLLPDVRPRAPITLPNMLPSHPSQLQHSTAIMDGDRIQMNSNSLFPDKNTFNSTNLGLRKMKEDQIRIEQQPHYEKKRRKRKRKSILIIDEQISLADEENMADYRYF